jgi:hypothetical protein
VPSTAWTVYVEMVRLYDVCVYVRIYAGRVAAVYFMHLFLRFSKDIRSKLKVTHTPAIYYRQGRLFT